MYFHIVSRQDLQKIYDFLINRRLTQTCADNIFSLADLARENLHALRANRFLKRGVIKVASFLIGTMLYPHT